MHVLSNMAKMMNLVRLRHERNEKIFQELHIVVSVYKKCQTAENVAAHQTKQFSCVCQQRQEGKKQLA